MCFKLRFIIYYDIDIIILNHIRRWDDRLLDLEFRDGARETFIHG